MYFDDHYDPNLENDYDEHAIPDSDTVFSQSQSNVTYQSQKATKKNYAKSNANSATRTGRETYTLASTDAGFSTIKRYVVKDVVLDMKVEIAKTDPTNGRLKYHRGKIAGINTLDGQVKYNVITVDGEKLYDLHASHILFPTAVSKGVLTKIGIYETPFFPGATIRNAVTGFHEIGNRVGSAKEDQFFKVSLASGEDGSREPRILFFDSPEQYERHFHCSLPAETKRRCNEKRFISLTESESSVSNEMCVIEVR
jgi:hypothetical protein